MGEAKMKDTRYRECMAEIAAILEKYDMAGAVTVVSKERAMFRYVFPQWSCIRLNGSELRFRAKRDDFPSKEAQHECVELSTHIVLQMRDIAAQTFGFMEKIHGQLAKNFEIDHEPFTDFDPDSTH